MDVHIHTHRHTHGIGAGTGPETGAHPGQAWPITAPLQASPDGAGGPCSPHCLWAGRGTGAHREGPCPCPCCPFSVDRKEGSIWIWMCLKHLLHGLWAAAKSLSSAQKKGLEVFRERKPPEGQDSGPGPHSPRSQHPQHFTAWRLRCCPAPAPAGHLGRAPRDPSPSASCRLCDLWPAP